MLEEQVSLRMKVQQPTLLASKYMPSYNFLLAL